MAIINSNILQAKSFLAQGKLIAIPTETVYGLAGNAYDEATVLNIFKVKKRPSFDPLIVHANTITDIHTFTTEIHPLALKLANYFWPGPLTLLLKKNKMIPDIVTSGSPYVGVRIPKHPLIQSLLAILPFPLAAPSANPFGYISPTKSVHVHDQLGNKIPYILDGGNCTVGIESTIVGFENEYPTIYRLGGISRFMIEQVIGPIVVNLQHVPQQPHLPGTFVRHYSPTRKLKIGDIMLLIQANQDKKVGILSFDHYYPGIEKKRQVILSTSGSLDEAARHLFAALRQLDQMPIDLIVTAYVPNHGIGVSINDRLYRASSS